MESRKKVNIVITNLQDRLDAIDGRLNAINLELGKLIGAQKTTTTLIKFIILPLIIILGSLVGIKLW